MKKIISLLLASSLTLITLVGCGTNNNGSSSVDNSSNNSSNNSNNSVNSNSEEEILIPMETVRLNEVVHSVFYAPQYVAMELGFFEEENIEIILDVGNGADTSMTALISGSADIALLGTEAGIYVYKEGMENYPKSFIQLTQRAGNFLISREENNNFNWSDLIGSSIIGGRGGGMPQMVLEYVLKENNIVPFEDVEIIDNLDFTSTAGAFAGEIGDYTVEFEPVATTMETSEIGYIVQSIGESAGELPYTVYMATDFFLEEKPEVLESFTKAIYKGQQWVEKNTSDDIAKVILPQFPDTDIDTLTTIVERYKSQNTWTTTPKFSEEGFSRLQDIMIDGGVLDEKVDFNELVTNEFAEKVIE